MPRRCSTRAAPFFLVASLDALSLGSNLPTSWPSFLASTCAGSWWRLTCSRHITRSDSLACLHCSLPRFLLSCATWSIYPCFCAFRPLSHWIVSRPPSTPIALTTQICPVRSVGNPLSLVLANATHTTGVSLPFPWSAACHLTSISLGRLNITASCFDL